MSYTTQVHPSAAILLTGISGAGKTTLARALVRRLQAFGIGNVVLVDGEELRERLPRRFGHSLAERDAVWSEIVKLVRAEMEAEKVVVIATIAHRGAMRDAARRCLQPFYEVHVDCPVEVCAARDVKGHYKRAYAGEYDCFIGVTDPYERTDAADLRLETAVLSTEQAEAQLADQVIAFLSRSADEGRPPSLRHRLARRIEEFVVNSPVSVRQPERGRRDLLANAASSRTIVHIERAACAQLALLYGGMDAFLGTRGKFSGMSPLEFMRRSGLFGRNLTWIRDPHGENFLRGVSESLNSAEALAEWTRAYIRSLPQLREVYTVGYSSGSYGALLFGHLCKVDSVWAFSPRTARRKDAEQAKARLRELLSHHNGVTRYHILFAHQNKLDRAFAEYFADCPGVTLHANREGGSRHYLIRYLAENGMLRAILPPFVPAGDGPSAAARL